MPDACLLVAWVAAGALLSGSASAQSPAADASPADAPPASAPAAPSPDLDRAKELFAQGNKLVAAHDHERALEFFLRSRALVAGVGNTQNAAFCLIQLKRYDEALDLLEELVTKFSDRFTVDERAKIAKDMADARGQLGSVDVIANVDGVLVIDGRQRGKLPLLTPVHVLPGEHVVQVMKDGFETSQARVSVAVGQTARVEAKLAPLAAAGRLRIDAADLAGAEIFVDGARVGAAPWEGTLAPGEHLFVLRKGDVGSAPKRVIVVVGQSVVGEAKLEPLGGEMRILAEPATADIFLGDVPLGRGRWQGRLPIGKYTVSASCEGYLPTKQSLGVAAGEGGDTRVKLAIDEKHPLWNTRKPGEIFFDAIGGFAAAPTLASGAEQACNTMQCGANPAALGFMAGARAGYEFWFGMSIELLGGYVRLDKSLSRGFGDSFTAGGATVPTSYDLADSIRISGPLAGIGLGYRRMLGAHLQVRGAVAVGALFAAAFDSISGNVSASDGSVPVAVDGSGAALHAVDLFVMPDLRLGYRFTSRFSMSLGLAVPIFVLSGPTYPYGDLALSGGNCNAAKPTAADCAPGRNNLNTERAYGPFATWLPSVTVGYAL